MSSVKFALLFVLVAVFSAAFVSADDSALEHFEDMEGEQDFEDMLLQVLQDTNQHPVSDAHGHGDDNEEEEEEDDEDNSNEEDDEKYDADTQTVPASQAGESAKATKTVVSAPGAAATHDPEAFLSVQAKTGSKTSTEADRRRRRGRKARRRSRRCRKRCKRRCRRRFSGPQNRLQRRRCVRRCRKRCNRRTRRQINVGSNAQTREAQIAQMQAANARFRSKLGQSVQRYAAKQTRKLIKWFITNYLNHASIRKHVAGRGIARDMYMPEPGPTPSDPEAPQTDGRRTRRKSRRRRARNPPRIPGLLQSVPRFG